MPARPGLSAAALPAAACCAFPLFSVLSCHVWCVPIAMPAVPLLLSLSLLLSLLAAGCTSAPPRCFFCASIHLRQSPYNVHLHIPQWQGRECIRAAEQQWEGRGRCAPTPCAAPPQPRYAGAAAAAALPLHLPGHLNNCGGRAGRLHQGMRCSAARGCTAPGLHCTVQSKVRQAFVVRCRETVQGLTGLGGRAHASIGIIYSFIVNRAIILCTGQHAYKGHTKARA